MVQATLCKAIAKLATYRGEAALFTWLCTFCRHEISAHYSRLRRTARETPLIEETPDVRAALESLGAASADGPDERLRRRELARLVQMTLDYLPDRYGDALEWKYIQELSVQEIALRLKVSPKAAESLLSRASEAFRDAFAAVSRRRQGMGAMSEHRARRGDDHIGRLLRLAGPREAVPADRLRRVKAAAHAEWRQQTRARSRKIAIGWSLGALAAAALVLVGVRLARRDDGRVESPRHELATIDALSGAVRLLSSSERAAEPTLFQIGDRIQAGDGVDTTSGGLAALRLAGGASVRVDRGTRLRLLSDDTLALDEGTIYVDSGDSRGARSLEVRTAVGIARDIGTRFEVRLHRLGA